MPSGPAGAAGIHKPARQRLAWLLAAASPSHATSAFRRVPGARPMIDPTTMAAPDPRGGVYDGHGRPLTHDALPWAGAGNVHELRRATRVLTLHATVEATPWPALTVALPIIATPAYFPEDLLAAVWTVIRDGGSVALQASTVEELVAPVAQMIERARVSACEVQVVDPSSIVSAAFNPAVRSPDGAPTEAVPLTLQQLAALASWHQKQAVVAAVPDDVAHHQRGAMRLVDAALRLMSGTASPPASSPAPVPAPSVVLSGRELLFLADEYARRASAEMENEHQEMSTVCATRALELRLTAHDLEPGCSLQYGHPRFPGLVGTA